MAKQHSKREAKGFTKLKKCKLSYLIFESRPTNGWKENSNKKINRRCEKNQQEYTYHCWMPFIEDRNSICDVFGNFLRLLLGQLHHLISVDSGKVLGKISIFSSLKGFEPILNFFNRKLFHWLLGVFWHSINFGLHFKK